MDHIFLQGLGELYNLWVFEALSQSSHSQQGQNVLKLLKKWKSLFQLFKYNGDSISWGGSCYMIESIQMLLNGRCGRTVLSAVGSNVRNKL